MNSSTADSRPSPARPASSAERCSTPATRPQASITGKSCWWVASSSSAARASESLGASVSKRVTIAARAVRPRTAVRLRWNDASWAAPRKTKIAISSSTGLTGGGNSASTANRIAMPWPTAAAIEVARSWPRKSERVARSTRPPSIGKAGIRLKKKRVRFAVSSCQTTGASVSSSIGEPGVRTPRTISQPNRSPARAAFTAGPASAMSSSALPDGIRSSRATPPIG